MRPADCVVAGIIGAAGLRPTLAAVSQGRRVALANKECLVLAGRMFMQAVRDAGTELLPVDSEHSAAFQAMAGSDPATIERIVLTASGGPFRTWSRERIAAATREEALKHPNWAMGPKITVDSASLMNKGLEVIEARWLFDLEPERVGVVVHPESIVHSLVEYVDGSMLAQLGLPDMRAPIALALAWPERLPLDVPRLAANEIAVAAFLAGETTFPAIAETCAGVLEAFLARPASVLRDLDDVLAVDEWARGAARERLTKRPVAAVPARAAGTLGGS
jgi:1-deoxy-D-xylulose-5-phosphate reductoisomerase